MAKIFINFQVGDGDMAAGSFEQRLVIEFGRDEVFRSSPCIQLGDDYRDELSNGVRDCLVLLVLIGSRWDARALHKPGNWVHREIADALAAGKRVIPILLEGVSMPAAESLPEDIRDLVTRQNFKVTHRDLHVWLDALPGLLLKAEPELGIGVVPGLEGLDESWRADAESARLPGTLPLGGREETVQEIEVWLAGPPSVRVLQGPSREEVTTFLSAWAAARQPPLRAVHASTPSGWRHAMRLLPLLVVASCRDVDIDLAARNGYHVLIPADPLDDIRHVTTVLSRLARDKARDAFLAQGLPYAEADSLAGVARRSLRALIRRLVAGRGTPLWATQPVPALALPLLLAGAWTDTSDRQAIERLTGRPYDEVERFATEHSNNNDPFLHRSGTRWQLADVQDAWALLHRTPTDPDRWSRLAFDVLFGDQSSEHLRHGVAQGIAAAGTLGDPRAEHLVVELLRHANEDTSGRRWAALADALPLLAEAAPVRFLDEVHQGLSGNNPVLAHLFTAAGSGRQPHVHLLWALGRLCWTTDHLLLGVRALARLAELDPDPTSNHRNRPAESLHDVLLPIMPFTTAPAERQRAAITDLWRRHPDIGWNLAIRFLSLDIGAHALTDRPKFRDWPTPFVQAPPEDSEPTFDLLVELVTKELARRPERWADVVGVLIRIPAAIRRKFVESLVGVDVDRLDGGERLRLWRALLDHLKYSTEDATALKEFADRVEPRDLPERHAGLFDSDFVSIRAFNDHAGHQEELHRLRVAAVEEVLESHGVGGLARLAAGTSSAQLVGKVAADIAGLTLYDDLLPLLKNNDASADLTLGWLAGVATEHAETLSERASAGLGTWDPVTQGRFLLALPRTSETMRLVRSAHPQAQALYWQLVPASPTPGNEEELFDELLERDRPESVLDGLHLALLRTTWTPPNALIVRTLYAVAQRPGRLLGSSGHEAGRLLDHLTASGADPDVIADLELAYFSALHHHRSPTNLYQRISTNPQEFVRLVELAMTKNDSRPVQEEAWFALFRCRTMPANEEWVTEVRRLLAETDHLADGETCVGYLLAGSPAGEDGAWPSEFVRDLLDDHDARTIAEGFVIGTLNNRETSIRALYEGGGQERELSSMYEEWAGRFEDRWPYAARVLRACAEGFDEQAGYWDRSAEDDHDA